MPCLQSKQASLLSAKDEVALAKQISKIKPYLLKRDEMTEEQGQQPTLSEWATACGFEDVEVRVLPDPSGGSCCSRLWAQLWQPSGCPRPHRKCAVVSEHRKPACARNLQSTGSECKCPARALPCCTIWGAAPSRPQPCTFRTQVASDEAPQAPVLTHASCVSDSHHLCRPSSREWPLERRRARP